MVNRWDTMNRGLLAVSKDGRWVKYSAFSELEKHAAWMEGRRDDLLEEQDRAIKLLRDALDVFKTNGLAFGGPIQDFLEGIDE